MRVYRVPHPNIYWSYRSVQRPGWQKLIWHAVESYNPRVASRVRPILEQEKPDVMHIRNVEDFSPYICQVASTLRIPVVVTLNSYTWLCPKATMFKNKRNCANQCWECKLITLPKKHLSRHVDAVVGVSQFMIERHQQYGYFPQAQPSVIYSSASAQKIPMPIQHNGYVALGYIGRVHPTKGVDQIIEAFKTLPPPHQLLIAGDGPEEYVRYCRSLAEDNRRIVFLGKYPATDFYRQVDAVVINSLWNEPFPRVLVEAYAAGRPVIAARTGGTPEMVSENYTGYTFDPQHPSQLAKRLHQITTLNSMQLTQLSSQVVTFFQQNIPDEAKRYLHLYQLLSGR